MANLGGGTPAPGAVTTPRASVFAGDALDVTEATTEQHLLTSSFGSTGDRRSRVAHKTGTILAVHLPQTAGGGASQTHPQVVVASRMLQPPCPSPSAP